jgi:hypothetical protein
MLNVLVTVKVCLLCTLFNGKIVLRAYFSVEFVIYTCAFGIVHIPEEEVNYMSASRTPAM